jgi:polyisoprenoid-binding protein YceI
MVVTTAPWSAQGIVFPQPGTWVFDRGHTRIGFAGRHLMVSRIRGTFMRFEGAISVGATPAETSAELKIAAASVESGFADRDNHLRSPDWFDVERYPEITVRAHSLRYVSDDLWAATAELTMRGITRSLPITIKYFGVTDDPWGQHKLGLTVSTEVDREAWGLTWNTPLKAGGVVVGKLIQLEIDVEAIRQ